VSPREQDLTISGLGVLLESFLGGISSSRGQGFCSKSKSEIHKAHTPLADSHLLTFPALVVPSSNTIHASQTLTSLPLPGWLGGTVIIRYRWIAETNSNRLQLVPHLIIMEAKYLESYPKFARIFSIYNQWRTVGTMSY